jgi:hypothetical protein
VLTTPKGAGQVGQRVAVQCRSGMDWIDIRVHASDNRPSRVRRSFRLEAKRCEKGSEKNFASKRNKGLVSLVSLRSETAIFACETKWT